MKTQSLASLAVLTCALAPAATPQGTAALFTGGFEDVGSDNRFEATYDLDGDGDLDAIGWWWHNCSSFTNCRRIRIRCYENQQQGTLGDWTFGWQMDLQGWWDTFDPAVWVGDLDGDPTKCELVFFRGSFFYVAQVWLDPSAHPQLQLQGQLLQETETFPACDSNWINNERAITVDDFNQDGRLDVGLSNGTQHFLMLQESTGLFVEGQATQIKPSFACSTTTGQGGYRLDIEAGEFNGDGRPDIVAVRQQYLDWSQTWSLPELIVTPIAGGQFFPPTINALDVGPGARVTLGDIDGDGDQDGVIFGANGYQVWRRDAAGALALEPLRTGGPATDLADIDGDGDLDGICCGGGGGWTNSNTSPSQFELCLNDGTGAFDDSVAYPGIGGHHVAGLIDVDGDGDPDILGGRTILINHLRTGAPFCLAGQNSTGSFARLSALGDTSLTRGNLALRATGAPTSTVGIFFTGVSELPAGTPLGGGNLCLGGAIRRMPAVQVDANGQVTFAVDLSDAALMGAVLEAGDVLRFQFWFRDVAGGSNATAGLRLVVAP